MINHDGETAKKAFLLAHNAKNITLADPQNQRCPEVIIRFQAREQTIASNSPLSHPSSLPIESKCCEKKESS